MTKKMKKSEKIDHAKFIEMLTTQFPEVTASFDESRIGLLHCEMAAFARITEDGMDKGNYWQVEKYLRFVEEVREHSSPELENAIDVSYLEFLAFSEYSEKRHQAIKERMPNALKEILLEIDGRGRWE
jgi:hypothetical protein